MHDFELLIGDWHGDGEIKTPSEPPMKLSQTVRIGRLGAFLVMSTVGEPAELPDSIAIIGGGADGEPQPMHYFDSRGVKRLFMTAVEGSTWKIWRAPGEDWNDANGPGFNQRFFRKDLGRRRHDRWPVGARPRRRRRRLGARFPDHIPSG